MSGGDSAGGPQSYQIKEMGNITPTPDISSYQIDKKINITATPPPLLTDISSPIRLIK